MPKKPIIAFLIVLLSVPLNAGAASSWMALSMSETDPREGLAMAMDQHSADSEQQQALRQSMQHSVHDAMDHSVASHDHNTEDCDEYCMSCSNHCSSTGIVSQSPVCFDPGQLRSRTSPGTTLNHPKLLFRPPIHG